MSSHAHHGQSGDGSGCAGVVAVMLVFGLAIEFWYVSVALILVGLAVWAISRSRRNRRDRHRPGLRDPWLNEVNVALADLGLTEHARNRHRTVGGIATEGDIELRTKRLEVQVALFGAPATPHQAEMGLRANEQYRDGLRRGYHALTINDSVLFLATGRGTLADDILLDEVTRVVARLAIGPALTPASRSFAAAPRAAPSRVVPQTAHATATTTLAELGRLHEAGVLTDQEFAEAKTGMLKRL